MQLFAEVGTECNAAHKTHLLLLELSGDAFTRIFMHLVMLYSACNACAGPFGAHARLHPTIRSLVARAAFTVCGSCNHGLPYPDDTGCC